MAADAIDVGARVERRARPPRPRTALIGRDDELAHLTRLIRTSDVLLITITGRGGSGKTRLALEAANRLGPDFPGGAVIVSLDAVASTDLLLTAVASALGLAVAPGQDPEAAVARELQFAPALLVVDDIDDLAGAADWFAGLVEEASGTKLVASARSPLHKPSERVVRIGPLIKTDERKLSDAELMNNPAVQLFADRAAAVQYNFKLDRANLRQVAELCQRLDGLPLAIELAAARSAALSPSAQLHLLERGSALEMGGQRGGLREAIALSYESLSSADQCALRSLSVFEGGASLDGARSIPSPNVDEDAFLDQLTTLVDFNLVEADRVSDEPRYRLLPMIREFARGQAVVLGELEADLSRLDDFFIAYASDAALLPEHLQVLALARERLNLEFVLGRIVDGGDVVRAAHLVALLGLLWETYGWFPVAEKWLDRLVSVVEGDSSIDPETRSLVLIWWVRLSLQHPAAVERAASIAERQKVGLDLARQSGNPDTILLALSAIYYSVLITHDFAAAVAATVEGLELARASQSERWIARFEVGVGVASNRSGDRATAVVLARSALARARRNDDLAGILAPVLMLREARSLGDEVTEPLPTSEELLALTRELGDVRGEGWMLSGLSSQSMARHDDPAAVRWAVETLELGRRTGLWDASGFACVHLAMLAAAKGDDSAVARLHGSIGRVMPELRIALPPAYMAEYQATIETARQRMRPDNFDRLAHGAEQLTWDEVTIAALDYARRLGSALAQPQSDAPAGQVAMVAELSPPDERETRLTRREREVLALLATGASNSEIAGRLGLSAKTAMNHSMNIYAKIGVRGRAEATAWAFRNGVVPAEN